MSRILYIKANTKPAGSSRTFEIADKFVEMYRSARPGDEILELDLYKSNIGFLTQEDINTVFGAKKEESRQHPILKYAYEFAGADKYIIAEPMWNLSIPAILKAYIDYITVTGITFKYTENGPVGLLENKKAVNIVTRGGIYSQGLPAGYEMGDRYLRTIFGFFGITDFTTISAEGLDIVGQDVEGIMSRAVQEAEVLAGKF